MENTKVMPLHLHVAGKKHEKKIQSESNAYEYHPTNRKRKK